MADNHTAQADSLTQENVIDLTHQIVQEGQQQQTELEKKRHIMFRAFELTSGQLEHDAGQLALRAVMSPPETLSLVQRQHMIHTSYMLQEAAAWIKTMLLPTKIEPNEGTKEPNSYPDSEIHP